ncbi:DNA-methyltransferase [Anaerovorax odorimutans]|uniref:DNA-methyltransferase n=1 Tax=Anaerovorax odorimutans TaxID=109327 RepID=UPI0003FF4CE1|nr:site-specific DNA-methyltransferase [Anaerovorax odorimutans]
MSLIAALPGILEECRIEYERLLNKNIIDLNISEIVNKPENRLVKGDNLEYMKYLLKAENMAGKINLIYVDPPFFSKADYGKQIKLESNKSDKTLKMQQLAYVDTWENGLEDYLKMLTVRFFMMKDLLCEEGCLWVHLDWHAVHYVKIILDEIFGADNFVNEVVWNYKSGGVSKKRFSRKHDTLLFYSKTQNYYFKPQKEKSYNRGFKPYRFKGVKEYQDEIGWYTMVNMKDVWQIDMVGRTSGERTGYATQKPEILLERILESCSKEGDLCADFFGGSGTLASVANKMNRNWISCDKGEASFLNSHKRLINEEAKYAVYETNLRKQRYTNIEEGIDINIQIEEANTNNKEKLLKVKFISYRPKYIEDIQFLKNISKDMRMILQEDSLQLIDFWSIDTDYDGQIFKSSENFIRTKNGIKLEYEKKGQNIGAAVCIRIIDVFGYSNFIVFDS